MKINDDLGEGGEGGGREKGILKKRQKKIVVKKKMLCVHVTLPFKKIIFSH